MSDPQRSALLDWLACAAGGVGQPAARAATAVGDGLLECVAAAAAAGHVLDFDDTYEPGLAHLSAPTAPAALMVAARSGASVGAAMDAYSAGFEAMGALARTCHPALYDGGWHPTAVCGSVGAAVAAARLWGLDPERERTAVGLALLRASGLRAAFGSDGKALQVALAASAGVHAAALSAAGASVDAAAIAGEVAGFAEAFRVATSAATLDDLIAAADAAVTDPRAAPQNWIKAYPCCLQTHGSIDAALALGRAPDQGARLAVAVHPLSRQAAAVDLPRDGLQAKFSIPYLTAYTLLYGAPSLRAFAGVDAPASELAASVRVRADRSLAVAETVLELDGREAARVTSPLGSPANPLGERALRAKVRALAGTALDGALDDLDRPALEVLRAAGLATAADGRSATLRRAGS